MSNNVSVFDLSFLQIVGLSAFFTVGAIVSEEIIWPAIDGEPSKYQKIDKIADDCAANPAGGSSIAIKGKTYTVACPR